MGVEQSILDSFVRDMDTMVHIAVQKQTLSSNWKYGLPLGDSVQRLFPISEPPFAIHRVHLWEPGLFRLHRFTPPLKDTGREELIREGFKVTQKILLRSPAPFGYLNTQNIVGFVV